LLYLSNNAKNFKAMKQNKEFVEVCLAELEKEADIYLLDEIGERFFFNNDI